MQNVTGKNTSIAFMFICILFLSGCFQAETIVKIKKDGSGVIQETGLFKKALLESGEIKYPTDEERNERAREMGEGVTFLSMSKVVTDDFEGFKAIYAFKDINQVKYIPNTEKKEPFFQGHNVKGDKKGFIFTFTKGEQAELLIENLEYDEAKLVDLKDSESSTDSEEYSEELKALMRELFRGALISIAVEVDGIILNTNATYKEGSKIILFQIDFNKLIEMEDELEKFSKSPPGTLEELKEFMKNIPGFKIDLNKEMRTTFK